MAFNELIFNLPYLNALSNFQFWSSVFRLFCSTEFHDVSTVFHREIFVN